MVLNNIINASVLRLSKYIIILFWASFTYPVNLIKVRLIVDLAVLVGIVTTANRPPLLGAGKDKKYLYKFLSSSSYILSEVAHIAP